MFAKLKKIFIVIAFPLKAGFKPTQFLNPNYFLNGLIFAPWLKFHNKKKKRSRRKWVAFNWVYCCIGNLQRAKNSITCSRNIDPPRFSAETRWQLLPATITSWLSKYNDNFGQQVIDLFLMRISSVILNYSRPWFLESTRSTWILALERNELLVFIGCPWEASLWICSFLFT